MDRFEELLAENEGLPSPATEREREIAKVKAHLRIDREIEIFNKSMGIKPMSIEDALDDWARYHGKSKA